jgi:hypothetical protein
MISMDGSSFCVAGKRAFRILSTNSLRVIAINSIGDFVLFLGKVFVVVATVLIGIELIQVRRKKSEPIVSAQPSLPTIDADFCRSRPAGRKATKIIITQRITNLRINVVKFLFS